MKTIQTKQISAPKQKKNRAVAFAIAGWVIIAISIVLAIGFALGSNYAEGQNKATTAKAVSMAAQLKN